jgi:hypothetical protein
MGEENGLQKEGKSEPRGRRRQIPRIVESVKAEKFRLFGNFKAAKIVVLPGLLVKH